MLERLEGRNGSSMAKDQGRMTSCVTSVNE